MTKGRIKKDATIGIRWLIAVGIILVTVFGFLFAYRWEGKQEYRTIQVYQVKGESTLTRESFGEIPAIEQFYLQTKDEGKTKEYSSMRLRMDEGEKYVFAEENTHFIMEASGSKKHSKTSIALKKGAIINEIQNKLSRKSQYQVTTPNAVMGVRGTVFRVAVAQNEAGEFFTKLDVFEGKVGVKMIQPDGTYSDEIIISAGKSALIKTDAVCTELLEDDVDYESLPLQALEYLKMLLEQGRSLEGITLERINEIMANKTCHIQFMFNGRVFATQTVEKYKRIAEPVLQPTSKGSWYWAFNTSAYQDGIINWQSSGDTNTSAFSVTEREDERGATKAIKIRTEVHREMDRAGEQKLETGEFYQLGEDSWQVNNDPTCYEGPLLFYVRESGNYRFYLRK